MRVPGGNEPAERDRAAGQRGGTEATTMIRDNFLQPTVNALGYTLTQFSIRWVRQ